MRLQVRLGERAPGAASRRDDGDDALVYRFGLTRREAEVTRLLARGERNAAIARTLGITPNTARHHTEHVMNKIGVRTRAQVVAVVRGDWLADRERFRRDGYEAAQRGRRARTRRRDSEPAAEQP